MHDLTGIFEEFPYKILKERRYLPGDALQEEDVVEKESEVDLVVLFENSHQAEKRRQHRQNADARRADACWKYKL